MASCTRPIRTLPSAARVLLLLVLFAATARADGEEPPAPAAPPEQPGPSLVMRGFGDINLVHRDDASPGGFSLGELDFFVTSELAPDLSVLAEIVLEPQEGETPEIEIERFSIRWAPRDAFQVQLGRMHTPLGYWNQAYHHGKWFQTTIDRPLVYRWEHDGGVLPVHEVGVAALGAFPVGSLSLEYSASVSNGRAAEPEVVQDFSDVDSHKAVNLWLGLVPRSLRARQRSCAPGSCPAWHRPTWRSWCIPRTPSRTCVRTSSAASCARSSAAGRRAGRSTSCSVARAARPATSCCAACSG
jgi:hypothetical protein